MAGACAHCSLSSGFGVGFDQPRTLCIGNILWSDCSLDQYESQEEQGLLHGQVGQKLGLGAATGGYAQGGEK